jgi:hypothetical protein
MGRDLLRDGDRPGGGQRAVIHAGAGDDVRDQADVRGGETVIRQGGMESRQVRLVHMRQDDVLLVADAQLVMAVALGEVGKRAHLIRRGIARRAPWALSETETMACPSALCGARLVSLQARKTGSAARAAS